ncbi:MAG: hypothetical protein ACD_75C01548G0001, partial [uncultured bacterium]
MQIFARKNMDYDNVITQERSKQKISAK